MNNKPCFLYCLVLLLCAFGCNPRDDLVILVNDNSPDSLKVGAFYAKHRMIPESHVLRIKCTEKESISREDFHIQIRDPLLEFLKKNNRLTKIRYLAVCYGIPLKIRETESKAGIRGGTKSSVDSELSLALWKNHDLKGIIQNPYYGQDVPIADMLQPGILLVSRLDGPNPEIAIGLIQKALEAEKTGVYGKGYFDLRGIREGGYALGDRWIHSAYMSCRKYGFLCEYDNKSSLLEKNYPMPDPVFYFGWYSSNMKGPFLQDNFSFRPGAVTYHLHSFSARSLRKKSWVRDMLLKGATASMGSVYEPGLSGTIDCGKFMDRFLKGYTFAEACYMSTQFISWQMTFVGDPLYAPFKKENLEKQQAELSYSDTNTRRLATILSISQMAYAKKYDEALTLATKQLPDFKGHQMLPQFLEAFLATPGAALELAEKIDLEALPEDIRGTVLYQLARLWQANDQTEKALISLYQLIETIPKHKNIEEALHFAIRLERNKVIPGKLNYYWKKLFELAKSPLWKDIAEAEIFFQGESVKYNKRLITAGYTTNSIKLDGKDDEKDWQTQNLQNGFTVNAGKPLDAEIDTEIKALYNDETLYLFVRCKHPDVEGIDVDPVMPRSQIWTNESIEIFMIPTRDYSSYLQMMTNLHANMWVNNYGQSPWLNSWDTAANQSDEDWSVEISIPFKNFGKKTPLPGEAWGINFCRNSEGKNSSWSPIKGGFHQPLQFGYVVFGEKEEEEQDEIEEQDQDKDSDQEKNRDLETETNQEGNSKTQIKD